MVNPNQHYHHSHDSAHPFHTHSTRMQPTASYVWWICFLTESYPCLFFPGPFKGGFTLSQALYAKFHIRILYARYILTQRVILEMWFNSLNFLREFTETQRSKSTSRLFRDNFCFQEYVEHLEIAPMLTSLRSNTKCCRISVGSCDYRDSGQSLRLAL